MAPKPRADGLKSSLPNSRYCMAPCYPIDPCDGVNLRGANGWGTGSDAASQPAIDRRSGVAPVRGEARRL